MYLIMPGTEDRSLEDKINISNDNKIEVVRSTSKTHVEINKIGTGIENKAFVKENFRV